MNDNSPIWKPHATVAAVIEKDQRFLMVEENIDGVNCINQPAGHLESGESLVTAVVRECLEETAWIVQPDYLIGIYRWQLADSEQTYLRFTFAAHAREQQIHQPLDNDIIAAHWLSYKQLASGKYSLRSPMVLRCIDDYLSGQEYSLSLLRDIEITENNVN